MRGLMSGSEQERLEAVIEAANDALVIIDERGVTDMLARARDERLLSDIVAAMTCAVDGRDPHAAHQSDQVAALARGSGPQGRKFAEEQLHG